MFGYRVRSRMADAMEESREAGHDGSVVASRKVMPTGVV